MLNTHVSPWPSFTEEEANYIAQLLLTNRVNYWTGDEGREFEREFASWCQVNHAVAVANGTVALEIALRAIGVGPGHEVVVTPRTFIASAASVVAVGARPVFADVDLDSQNITARSVSEVLSPSTRAVLCVHLAGWPCEMDELRALAADRQLALIEDCAQAHGANLRGRPVGGLGDIAAWSFCQDKIISTAGEGGMITTSDESLWECAWAYKDHGKSFDAVYNREHPPGFRWLHESFGSNARMTEVQAAVGRLQLRRMRSWHERRSRNAQRVLDVGAKCSALRVPSVPPHVEHAWYRAYVFVRPEALRADWSRDRIMAEINELGIPCTTGSCSEIYLERAFERDLRPARRLPNAQELGETSLAFLVHPTLTDAEIDATCRAIKTVAERAQR